MNCEQGFPRYRRPCGGPDETKGVFKCRIECGPGFKVSGTNRKYFNMSIWVLRRLSKENEMSRKTKRAEILEGAPGDARTRDSMRTKIRRNEASSSAEWKTGSNFSRWPFFIFFVFVSNWIKLAQKWLGKTEIFSNARPVESLRRLLDRFGIALDSKNDHSTRLKHKVKFFFY